MSANFNKELLLKVAESYLKNNQVSAAITEYKKIAETTHDPNIMNLLGDLYIRVGDIKKAIDWFSPVAESYSRDGFTVKAIAMYKKICKLDANNIELILKLANLYASQKHLVEARQLYKQVLEVYKTTKSNQEIIKILKLIINVDPENITKRLELAALYQKEGLFIEAQETCFQASRELLRQGKAIEAIRILEEVFSLNPTSKLALVNLVDSLILIKETEKAIDILKNAIKVDPDDIDLLVISGKTYLRISMLDEAEKTFIDLFTKDNSRYEYLIELAKVFLANKEFDRVIDLLELSFDIVLEKRQKRKVTTILKEILKQDPNHIKTVKSLVYIYQKIEETHNLVATLNLLVKIAQNNGRQEEAISALRHLMKIEPQNISYKETLKNIKNNSLDTNSSSTNLGKAVSNISKQNAFSETKQEAIASNHTHELLEGMIKENGSYIDAQLELLEAMVVSNPDYLEARVKLKNLYLQKELKEKAAKQCLEISKLYLETKNLEKAKAILEEVFQYDPLLTKTEEFNLVLEQSKSSLEKTHEVEAQKQPKKETKPRIKRPTDAILLGTLSTLSTVNPVNPMLNPTNSAQQLSLDVFSKQQIKENLELNFSQPSFEVDLSNIFSKQETETFIKPTTLDNNQALLLEDIDWLAKENQPLDREWRRGIRSNQEISLVVIKVENFTEYLVSFGQIIAEKCIRELLKTIQLTIHRGGDQLLTFDRKDILFLILPETSNDGALIVAQRIKKAVSDMEPFLDANLLTVSQIIATAKPKRSNKPMILVKKIISNYSKLSMSGQIFAVDE